WSRSLQLPKSRQCPNGELSIVTDKEVAGCDSAHVTDSAVINQPANDHNALKILLLGRAIVERLQNDLVQIPATKPPSGRLPPGQRAGHHFLRGITRK